MEQRQAAAHRGAGRTAPGDLPELWAVVVGVGSRPGRRVTQSRRAWLAMHPFLAKVASEELLAELVGREAFGRSAEPWEVANVMVFLASDYASYLTGDVVSVSSQHHLALDGVRERD